MILSEPLSEKMASKISTIFSLLVGSHTVYSLVTPQVFTMATNTHVKHNKQKTWIHSNCLSLKICLFWNI